MLYNWVVPKSLSAQLPKTGGTYWKIMRKRKSKNEENNSKGKIITWLRVRHYVRLMILKNIQVFCIWLVVFHIVKEN